GLSQNKSHGDILQLLSDEGSISAKEFIYIVENQEIFVWFNKINPSLDSIFSTYELKMQDATISSSELEFLCDLLLYKTLDQGRYNVEGPLVLARYLLGCEFEVKNLRMIISALQNTIPFESIKERIRPHYGS
ncbi:TPA: V-type ATPase subunit, partial [Streptococcus pneumoniae]|nr:V-type ATPase subunit [Streptococcus pneumoniae]